jgi:hypothetical protein
MILEPDNSDWNGTTIGQALAATGARLTAAGFTPDFIAPSNTNMQSAIQFFDDMIGVPGVRQYLKEFSYHRYSGVSAANLQAIGARATQYGVRTAMLEHIPSGYEDLHADLKVARNSAWQEFALAYPGTGNEGGIYYGIDTASVGRPLVRITPRAKFLRQYFRYIRPGAQRIEAISAKEDFDPLAFINTNGRYVVVVKADDDGTFTVGGLPAGRYGITYTTSAQYNINLPDVDLAAAQNLAATIPAAGAITIYGK